MHFNTETLYQYCKSNNITLIKNYQDIEIKRENFIEGKCTTINCEYTFNKTFRNMVKTGSYCKVCIQQIKSNNFKQTNLQKYGTENPQQNKNIKEKTKQTNLERYGVENILQSKECQDKVKQTNLQRYGVEHPQQNFIIFEKTKQTNLQKYGVENPQQNKTIKKKTKQTNLQKYGTENPAQSKECRDKVKQTNLQRYGIEYPQQNSEIFEKTKQTNLHRYGVENVLQNKECREQIKLTNLKRYGVENPQQNPAIAEQTLKSSFNKKQYTMPSGKIVDYQGYENFAFDELINVEKIDEYDLITNRKDVPELWYLDKLGKKRRHYVDMYIKTQNRCIEVKSTWTNQAKNNVFEKQKSAIELGYKYEIWIYDNKGNKLSAH
jgi:hypothetical protein